MSTYRYYRDNCALCGELLPVREMNKLTILKSHVINPTPKRLCCVCDRCFPKVMDFLEVSEPEDKEPRPWVPRRWCRKCITYVGKTAKYCPQCGDALAEQQEDQT